MFYASDVNDVWRALKVGKMTNLFKCSYENGHLTLAANAAVMRAYFLNSGSGFFYFEENTMNNSVHQHYILLWYFVKGIIIFLNCLTLFFFFLIVWNFTLSKLQDPPAAKNVAFTLLSACGKILLLTYSSLPLYLTDGALIRHVSVCGPWCHIMEWLFKCWQWSYYYSLSYEYTIQCWQFEKKIT